MNPMTPTQLRITMSLCTTGLKFIQQAALKGVASAGDLAAVGLVEGSGLRLASLRRFITEIRGVTGDLLAALDKLETEKGSQS